MPKDLILNESGLPDARLRALLGVTEQISCQTLDWHTPLRGEGISHAILALNFSAYAGGPLMRQLEFLSAGTAVRSWIVVLLDVSGVFGPAVDKWRLAGTELSVNMDILYAHPQRPALEEQVRQALEKNPARCLLGYYSRKEDAEDAARLFGACLPDWDFDAAPAEALEGEIRRSGKLILMGRDEMEFQFAPVPVNQERDMLLLMDCSGPLFPEIAAFRMENAAAILRENGWKLSLRLPRYVVGNLRYEAWKLRRQKLEKWEVDEDAQTMAIWDEYGLPLLHGERTEDRLDRFLDAFHCVEEVGRWLQGEGMAPGAGAP